MEVTFGDKSIKYLLDVFDLQTNDDGDIITEDGSVVTDAFGYRVSEDEVGAIVNLDGSEWDVNSDGRVEKNGEVITKQYSENKSPEAIVPVTNEVGIVRNDVGSMIDYSNS